MKNIQTRYLFELYFDNDNKCGKLIFFFTCEKKIVISWMLDGHKQLLWLDINSDKKMDDLVSTVRKEGEEKEHVIHKREKIIKYKIGEREMNV